MQRKKSNETDVKILAAEFPLFIFYDENNK